MGRLKLITAVCSSIVVLCMARIADAELIQKDLKTPGDGLITLDTVTGLEWLDLTATIHRSYEDVSNQLHKGGEFEGFTYASEGEVRALFTNAGIPNLSGDWDAANYQPTLALQALIGEVTFYTGATYENGSGANTVVGIKLQVNNFPTSPLYEQARVVVDPYVEIDRTAFLAHWLRRSIYPSTSSLGNVVRWENRFHGATTGWDTTTVIDPGVEFILLLHLGKPM